MGEEVEVGCGQGNLGGQRSRSGQRSKDRQSGRNKGRENEALENVEVILGL